MNECGRAAAGVPDSTLFLRQARAASIESPGSSLGETKQQLFTLFPSLSVRESAWSRSRPACHATVALTAPDPCATADPQARHKCTATTWWWWHWQRDLRLPDPSLRQAASVRRTAMPARRAPVLVEARLSCAEPFH